MTATSNSAARDTGSPQSVDMPEVFATLTQALAAQPRQASRRTRRLRFGVAIGLTALSGTSALAATGVWNPLASSGPQSSSVAPVPSEVADSLSVLRLPQTDRDRGPLISRFFEQELPELSGDDGTRLASVRFLRTITTTLSGGGSGNGFVHKTTPAALFVVSKERVTTQPTLGTPDQPLCMISVRPSLASAGADSRVDSSVACASLAAFKSGGLVTESYGELHGLVPDDVSSVRARTVSGVTVEAAVDRNSFEIVTPTRDVVHPGSPTPDAANSFDDTLEWLDSQKNPIRSVPLS